VTVAVEPDLSHLKVGQTVHLLPVASKSVIGSSFSIALPRSPALAALAGTSGDLNVVVRVATAHGMTTRFVVVRYGNAGAASGQPGGRVRQPRAAQRLLADAHRRGHARLRGSSRSELEL